MINHLIRIISIISKYADTVLFKMFKYGSGAACTSALTVLALTDYIKAFFFALYINSAISLALGKYVSNVNP